MTENDALSKAQDQIRAENNAYLREWRKRNPDKVKASRERYKQKRLLRKCEEVKQNGQCRD